MNFSIGCHLGDALWGALFLRRLKGQHNYFISSQYVEAVSELMNDTQISIRPLEEKPADAMDLWIANAQFEADGVKWTREEDVMGFIMRYFNAASRRLEGRDVFLSRNDLLWDSMSIIDALAEVDHPEILIINSDPMSGQCPYYSRDQMNELIVSMSMRWKGSVVATTVSHRPNFTLAQIAAMSITAKTIIAVANGPHWATWNFWNRKANRIILLEYEKLDFGTGANVVHCANVGQVMEQMKRLS